MKIDFISFDWAGTIVDHGSRAPVAVFVAAFAAEGIEVTEAEARVPMGMAKRAHIETILAMPRVHALWLARFGTAPTDADIDRLYDLFLPRQMESIERHADAIPGAPELFAALRERGIKIGSSTGYAAEIMAKLLPVAAANGIAPDHVCCASDVAVGRPAPWMIYAGAQHFGIYPMARVVVVDDTLAGIRAARNAGCWAVGVVESGNEFGLSAEALAALPAVERAARYAVAEARLREAGAHTVIASVASLLPEVEAFEARLAAGEFP